MFYKPLIPLPQDQGDSYALKSPLGVAPYTYYVYTTGQNNEENKAFSVYATNDLEDWTYFGELLNMSVLSAHWAPCVHDIPGLE